MKYVLGWGGFLCNLEIDECMSTPCQNGAVCVDLHADYSCACLFGEYNYFRLNNSQYIVYRCSVILLKYTKRIKLK